MSNLKNIHKENKSTSDLSLVDLSLKVGTVADQLLPAIVNPTTVVNNAEYNKRMCHSLLAFIRAGEAELRKLHSIEKEKELPNDIYRQLSNTIRRAKGFILEISQASNFQKYAKSASIKEMFDELTQEYSRLISLLNLSLSVDSFLNQEKLMEISEKKIDKLEFTGQERQEFKEENLQEKLKPSLEQFTELSKQSKQIEESLTKEEQEITDLEILIEYKQNNIKTNENEIKNSPNNEEERIKLEKQITNLKNQIVSLQNQLIEKGKELANLKQENNKLIEQCLFYLTLIKSFREKQRELEEKKKELIENKKNLSEKELDNFCQLKEEYRSLETDLEEIIIVEQLLTEGERPKKRYWKSEELLVDQVIIDKWDKVLAEIRGYELPKEKSFFEEILQKIIKSCDKNTVKSALLISRTNKDKFGLVNTYNEVTPKGKEIIEKMIIFLNGKQIFLNTRQGTIERLQECYEKFKISIDTGKYSIGTQLSNLVISIGEMIPDLGGNITKGVGGIYNGTVNLFKNNAWKNCRSNFKKFLANDEKKLFWLKEIYQSLITIIWDNEEQPISSVIIEILKLEKHKKESSFNEKYNIYRIGGNILFQGENTLELEEMKKMIILLNSNFEEIKSELEEEKSKVYEQLKNIQIPKIQISDYNNSIEPLSLSN